MATINGSTNNNNWTYKLEVSESNVNINNNTSVVTVTAYLGRASSTSYIGGTWSGSITVNGSSQNISGTIPYPTYINGGGWYSLATISFTVTHNNDGTKTVGVSSLFSSGDFTPSSASASGNVTLSTIPRASKITATSVYIGETSQLTITRYSTDFTHTIQYSFGSLTGYILADGTTTATATKITATSIGFPIPSSWYAQIPNSKQGTCTLTIKTYNGNTQIGSTQTTTFTARIDELTNKPTITATVSDTGHETYALTGNRNYLVKGFSIPEVTWSATAQNNSTISSVTINGQTVSTSPYTFTLVDNNITIIATDSRGFTTTYNPTFTLIDYNVPSFTMIVERVSPTSDYANVKFEGTWFNENFGSTNNSLQIVWNYRKSGDTNWITGGTLIENTDYKINNNNFFSGNLSSASDIQIGGLLEYAYGWDISINVIDELSETVISNQITKGIPIINWGEDFLNVNGTLKINNSRYISEAGKSIKIAMSDDQSVSPNTTTIINLDTVVYNFSSQLQCLNNAIYIGEGISSVLVDCRWSSWGADANNRYIYIAQNDNMVTLSNRAYSSTMETASVIPVQEGDYIQVKAYHEQNSSITVSSSVTQTFLKVTILD